MKPRISKERHLHKEFEQILQEGGLTGQEKREARRRVKRRMSKISRAIDKNITNDELDELE
jgi:hypothetical protein